MLIGFYVFRLSLQEIFSGSIPNGSLAFANFYRAFCQWVYSSDGPEHISIRVGVEDRYCENDATAENSVIIRWFCQ